MSDDLSPHLQDLIALNLIPNLGPRLTAALLKHFGSAAAVRRATAAELRQVNHVGEKLSQQFAAALAGVDPARECESIARHGVRVLVLGASDYPASLARIADPPHLLYVRGSFAPADQRAVAIVGSRGCTGYGRRVTEALATGLVQAGYTIVSGLARGTGKHIPEDARERLLIPITASDLRLSGWSDKRRRAVDALSAEPNASDTSIGRRLRIHYHFIGRIRKELETAGAIPRHEKRYDTGGRRQPVRGVRTNSYRGKQKL